MKYPKSEKIEAGIFTVGELIKRCKKSGQLTIPGDYQRPYVWESPQIRQLLTDIVDCMNNDCNKFINSIVLESFKVEEMPEVLKISDGQQRLTTIFLLLSILATTEEQRKMLFMTNKEKEKVAILNSTVYENAAAIELYMENSKYYEDSNISDTLKPNWLLVADKKCKYETRSLPEDKKSKLFDYILNNVTMNISIIPVGAGVDAFETLNSTGKKLGHIDILKGKLAATILKDPDAEDALSEFTLMWEKCIQNCVTKDFNGTAMNYIAMKLGFRDVDKVAAKLRSVGEIRDFMQDMLIYMVNIAKMENRFGEYYKDTYDIRSKCKVAYKSVLYFMGKMKLTYSGAIQFVNILFQDPETLQSLRGRRSDFALREIKFILDENGNIQSEYMELCKQMYKRESNDPVAEDDSKFLGEVDIFIKKKINTWKRDNGTTIS